MPGKNTPEQPRVPKLVRSLEDATRLIKVQLDEGHALQTQSVTSDTQYDEWRKHERLWHDYTQQLLKMLFDNESVASEFSWSSPFGGLSSDSTLRERIDETMDDLNYAVSR